jgi:hypothetical protein
MLPPNHFFAGAAIFSRPSCLAHFSSRDDALLGRVARGTASFTEQRSVFYFPSMRAAVN